MYIYMGIDTIAYRDKCTDTYDNARIYTNKLAYMHIYAYVQAYILTYIHTDTGVHDAMIMHVPTQYLPCFVCPT